MASSTFRIERRGSQFNIEVLTGTGTGSTLSLHVPSELVVAALLEALDLKLTVSAGGNVGLWVEDLDDCAGSARPQLSVPIDELIEVMTAAVVKTPDIEDAAALETTLRRLEHASLCVRKALQLVKET